MAGPASNMASILVIRRVMGQRTLWLYLGSLTLGAIVFGLGVDFLLPRELFTSLLSPTDACCHMGTPWWQWASTVVMGALLLYALVVAPLLHRAPHKHAPAENTTKIRRFAVDGMTCHHCSAHVEKALQNVPGGDARGGESGTRRSTGGRRRHRRRTDASGGRHRLHAATPLR